MNTYEERQEAKRGRMRTRAARLRQEGETLSAAGRKSLEAIPFGQPILVGHHSEKSDRSYRNRAVSKIDKGYRLEDEANDLESRADRVGTGGVSSDDPEAVNKLTTQLEQAKEAHELMLDVNDAHKNFLKNPDLLDHYGFSDALKEKVRTYVPQYSWEKHPFPPYSIRNSSANIRRIEKRIEQLQRTAAAPERAAVQGNGWTMREDKAENRIMFVFPGKPSEDVRAVLKSRAFVWSPSRGAWVRKITGNARFAADQVITKLNEMNV